MSSWMVLDMFRGDTGRKGARLTGRLGNVHGKAHIGLDGKPAVVQLALKNAGLVTQPAAHLIQQIAVISRTAAR